MIKLETNKITSSRIRPFFYIVFFCWILFSEKGIDIELSPTQESLNFGIMALLFLVSAFIFQIRENIKVEEGILHFNLYKHSATIELSAIKAITPKDSWNILEVETPNSKMMFRTNRFSRKAIEEFFVINNLYITNETNEKGSEFNMRL